MTLFLVDLRTAGDKLTVRPIQTMLNAETNELFFDGLEVPVENRIGEEGKGFRYLLSGVNSERIAVASEAVGHGLYFVDKASQYASDRVVFGRPIGQNQGVQLPIAKAYANLQAANLAVFHAARLYDQDIQCGEEANIAKYLASEAHWEAANAAMTAFGGYGYAVEFDIERHFRHARLGLTAPVSNNLVLSFLGHQVLGMPRSY
jgi:alkylation response protein AidB-like acyl-CoA dehydrogenase